MRKGFQHPSSITPAPLRARATPGSTALRARCHRVEISTNVETGRWREARIYERAQRCWRAQQRMNELHSRSGGESSEPSRDLRLGLHADDPIDLAALVEHQERR